jgi:hypothetical protein
VRDKQTTEAVGDEHRIRLCREQSFVYCVNPVREFGLVPTGRLEPLEAFVGTFPKALPMGVVGAADAG